MIPGAQYHGQLASWNRSSGLVHPIRTNLVWTFFCRPVTPPPQSLLGIHVQLVGSAPKQIVVILTYLRLLYKFNAHTGPHHPNPEDKLREDDCLIYRLAVG